MWLVQIISFCVHNLIHNQAPAETVEAEPMEVVELQKFREEDGMFLVNWSTDEVTWASTDT